MADIFKIEGIYSAVNPKPNDFSSEPSVITSILETMGIKAKTVVSYVLTDDAPKSIDLGGCAQAHVVVIKTRGGKVRARFTSSDGSSQAVPVNPFFVLMSSSVGFTAIDVTRVAGVETDVQILLGERV